MKTAFREVTNNLGETKRALFVICERCGGDRFMIYSIEGHEHLQCVECNLGYCDGTCAQPQH